MLDIGKFREIKKYQNSKIYWSVNAISMYTGIEENLVEIVLNTTEKEYFQNKTLDISPKVGSKSKGVVKSNSTNKQAKAKNINASQKNKSKKNKKKAKKKAKKRGQKTFSGNVKEEKNMFIGSRTEIYTGNIEAHDCIDDQFIIKPCKRILVNDSHNMENLNFLICDKCNKLFVRKAVAQNIHNNFKKYVVEKIEPKISNAKNNDQISNITIHDFIVRSHMVQCTIREHCLIEVRANVEILKNTNQIEVINVPAAYCTECGVYFILEREYRLLKAKGHILCKVVEEELWIKAYNNKDFLLKDKSVLYLLGYNVSAQANISEKRRQRILQIIVDRKIWSKIEVCSHLDYLIKRSKNRANFNEAISKWEADRTYITKYNPSKIDVSVKSINNTVRNYTKNKR